MRHRGYHIRHRRPDRPPPRVPPYPTRGSTASSLSPASAEPQLTERAAAPEPGRCPPGHSPHRPRRPRPPPLSKPPHIHHLPAPTLHPLPTPLTDCRPAALRQLPACAITAAPPTPSQPCLRPRTAGVLPLTSLDQAPAHRARPGPRAAAPTPNTPRTYVSDLTTTLPRFHTHSTSCSHSKRDPDGFAALSHETTSLP